jgi:Domain of unknown function (DUF4419)
MPHTFNVDSVNAVLTPLPRHSVRDRFPDILDGSSSAGFIVDADEAHPLIGAVHLAFSQHRPLVLTPDAVWLTIAQGFAQHLRINSETLRERFVRHSGKKTLTVEYPHAVLPEKMEPIIDQFRQILGEELGTGMARLMICDFSTTTDVERTASAVIFMDAFQPYFEYLLVCICGIPRITVMGTEEDWRAIAERVRILGEYDLSWWTTHVEKIVQKLGDAAAGRPDKAFFQRIYKPENAYGGEVVTGWIGRLYPYIKSDGAFQRINPMLEIPEESVGKRKKADRTLFFENECPAIRTDDTMPGLSKVELTVKFPDKHDRKLDLIAGLMGVTQLEDGSLEAKAGWFVQKASLDIGEVLDQLRQAGFRGRPLPDPSDHRFSRIEGPADLMALYSAFDGGTLPFGWSLRSSHEFQDCFHKFEASYYYSDVHITIFADLPDHSTLGVVRGYREPDGKHWGVVHLPPGSITESSKRNELFETSSLACGPREVAWIGNSISEVVLRALETGGADPRIRAETPVPNLMEFADIGRKRE